MTSLHVMVIFFGKNYISTTGGHGPSFQRGGGGGGVLHKGCKKGLLGGVKTRAPAMGTPLPPPPPCAHV